MPDVAIDEDDPAVILYTSGTTGRAKGATHSHRNVVGLVQAQQQLAASTAAAGHDAATGGCSTARRCFTCPDSTAVSSPAGSGVDHRLAARSLRPGGDAAADRAGAVHELDDNADDVVAGRAPPGCVVVRHESLRHIGGGGAAWSPALQQKIREVFGEQVTWGVGYGLTECTALATSASLADLLEHPETVGRPVATVEVRVDDSGEILVRGPMVMLGYWRNDEATAAVIDDEGWLHTGDLGEIRDGLLYLTTRRTDLILRGAENVYPSEIENCLEAHPDVEEVAVVGLPDEEFGQQVAAVVVPSAGAQPDDATPGGVREGTAGLLQGAVAVVLP